MTNILEIFQNAYHVDLYLTQRHREFFFAHLARTLFLSRGVFRTPTSIKDGVFLRIQLTTLTC